MLCGVRTVGGRRVLVVDGERAQAQRTAAGLRARGFEPIVLGRLSRAVCELERRPHVAIVSEVRARGAGFQYRMLSDLARLSGRTRIVVLTRCGSAAGRAEAASFGVLDYLDKPASDERLIASVLGEPGPVDPARLATAARTHDAILWEHDGWELRRHRWCITRTARALDIHRTTLIRRLDEGPPHRRTWA
jgi:ActR/RegA family two-component response regulator